MYTTDRDSRVYAKIETPVEAGKAFVTAKTTSGEVWTESCLFLGLPTEIRVKIYGYILPKPSSPKPRSRENCHSPLNILLINRQIHAESSSVLYSHSPLITMLYGFRTIPSLGIQEKGKGTKRHGTLRSKSWQFHPITDVKFLEIGGVHAFNPLALGNAVYPHVLARFRRITLQVPLVYVEYGAIIPAFLEIDSKFNVDVTSARCLAEQMRRYQMLDDFAKIISGSDHIVRLDIEILVNVEAVFKYKPTFGNDTDLVKCKQEMSNAKKTSNQQAVQMFFESGQLDRLQKMSTIQSITLTFFKESGLDLQDELLPETLDAVKDLQRTVERNWEEKHQSISKHPAMIGI